MEAGRSVAAAGDTKEVERKIRRGGCSPLEKETIRVFGFFYGCIFFGPRILALTNSIYSFFLAKISKAILNLCVFFNMVIDF